MVLAFKHTLDVQQSRRKQTSRMTFMHGQNVGTSNCGYTRRASLPKTSFLCDQPFGVTCCDVESECEVCSVEILGVSIGEAKSNGACFDLWLRRESGCAECERSQVIVREGMGVGKDGLAVTSTVTGGPTRLAVPNHVPEDSAVSAGVR